MPYVHGYSRESISHNISLFSREGYRHEQAIAMSLSIARRAWKKTHPRKPYPHELHMPRGYVSAANAALGMKRRKRKRSSARNRACACAGSYSAYGR